MAGNGKTLFMFAANKTEIEIKKKKFQGKVNICSLTHDKTNHRREERAFCYILSLHFSLPQHVPPSRNVNCPITINYVTYSFGDWLSEWLTYSPATGSYGLHATVLPCPPFKASFDLCFHEIYHANKNVKNFIHIFLNKRI